VFGKGQKGLESTGTDVGLYLVGALVEMDGGDVRVADDAPAGAVLVVRLSTDTAGSKRPCESSTSAPNRGV
jgi:K+-sensing histidine kinase KdpD